MPTEDPSMVQVPWIYQAVVTALIALVLNLFAACLIFFYKQRVIASVEIVVNTRIDPNTVDVVVTNHGRSAIVITELKIHIPVEDVIPGLPLPIPNGPNFKKVRLFKIRRKLKTRESRNDLLRMVAESQLSQGTFTHDIIKTTETMRVGPHEKASRPLKGQNLPAYLPKLEPSNPSTFIPSCKIANHKSEIWGSPVTIGKTKIGGNDWPMVLKMDWK